MSYALTRDLSAGWNLISMPVQVDSEASSYIRTHIDGVFYKMWAYDGEWKKYNPFIDGNDLQVIKKNSAFWIQVGPNGAQLTIDDSSKMSPLSITKSGWHLSSFNQSSEKSFKTDIFNSKSIKSSHSLSNISKIWGFDQSWRSLRPNDGVGSLLSLEPGMGYWIKAVNTENLISTNNPLMIDPVSTDSSDATTNSTFDVKVSGSIIDSLSLAPIGLFTTRVLQLSVLGDDQNLVYDSANSQRNQFTTTDGQFEFWIKGISASLSKKKNLRLIIEENKDYLSTSASFTIATSQEIQLDVPMVNLNSNFQASGIVTNKVSLDIPISGILGSAVTLVTSSPNVNGQVEIVVPAGVQMSDNEGNVLTGKLNLQATYFSPTETSSLNAFPGGLNNINIEVDGEKKQGYFISGGFTAIEILDQNKTHVKTFSQPISVKMEVPSSTINPETGVPLKANDQFPIWSYSPETGQWTSEGFGLAVGPNAKNNFEITFQTDHLSYYNLDWFSDEKCDGSIEFNVIGDEPDLAGTKELKWLFYMSNTAFKRKKIEMIDGRIEPILFSNAPKGKRFEYSINYLGYEIFKIEKDDFCIDEAHQITIPFTSITKVKPVKISIASSSSQNITYHVYAGRRGGVFYNLGSLNAANKSEILTFEGLQNQEYSIFIRNDKLLHFLFKEIKINEENSVIEFNVDQLGVSKLYVHSVQLNENILDYSLERSGEYIVSDHIVKEGGNLQIKFNYNSELGKSSRPINFSFQVISDSFFGRISVNNINMKSSVGNRQCQFEPSEEGLYYEFSHPGGFTKVNDQVVVYENCSITFDLVKYYKSLSSEIPNYLQSVMPGYISNFPLAKNFNYSLTFYDFPLEHNGKPVTNIKGKRTLK
ncbi:MAG: hypothetical protein KC646_01210 [Candidatus Cloacimonetes bacterium]|nr:hypothetical protein [Candidatus Cloacimonadota bacterium]